MPSLPDWAPNLHPLIVHFPIGLLYAAALADLLGLFAGQRPFLRKVALLLYLAGTLAALATWYTGKLAADSVFLPADANALLTEHADLGEWTLWYFGGYALLRLALSFGRAARAIGFRFIAFLLGAGGVGLVTVTAGHGAELVFRHGAGVQAVEERPEPTELPADSTLVATGGVVQGDSAWHFVPTRAAAWATSFAWLEGSAAIGRPALVDAGERGDVLAFDAAGDVIFFVTPDSFAAVQVDLDLDVSGFDGSVMIAHHVVDASNYGFAAFGPSGVRVGRSENGDLLIDGTVPFDHKGWHSLRLVADRGHFRTYVDTELAAHAHGEPGTPGPVGIRLNGTGRVRLARMTITSLR